MADRRAVFARLHRLRATERRNALAHLADARAEQIRMDEIARRSRALAGAGAAMPGAQDGAALAATLAFHARLTGLARHADQMSARAREAEANARTGLSQAEARLQQVDTRRQQIAREADERKMARSLLQTLHNPRESR